MDEWTDGRTGGWMDDDDESQMDRSSFAGVLRALPWIHHTIATFLDDRNLVFYFPCAAHPPTSSMLSVPCLFTGLAHKVTACTKSSPENTG